MSSRPFTKHSFLNGLMSNGSVLPVALFVINCRGRSIVSVASGLAYMEANTSERKPGVTTTGNSPLFIELFLKMSAKKLLTTARKP